MHHHGDGVAGGAAGTVAGHGLDGVELVGVDGQAGEPVDGPLTAFMQAEVINTHYLESTAGKTYAELDREDPLRQVAMNASFLRASLFTSVVAYGVAAMAMGIGLVFGFIGTALTRRFPNRPTGSTFPGRSLTQPDQELVIPYPWARGQVTPDCSTFARHGRSMM